MNADQILTAIREDRLVMVVRGPSAAHARRVVDAAVAGGIRIVEITFTVPDATELLASLAQQSDVLAGAGTVLDRGQAAAAVDAGARFLVSPGLDLDVVTLGRERGVLTVPGVLTPTEVMTATAAGALAIKLFPAEPLGTRYLRALLSPFPTLQVIPSGGLTLASALEWLGAGAIAVGMGGPLSPTGSLDEDTIKGVTAAARTALAAVRTTKGRENS